MKGAEDLIKMRLAGIKPPSVTIYDYPNDTDWARWGDLPRVCTSGEKIGHIDLRFVIGLTVYIEGHDPRRVDFLREKCEEMGAEIVAASCYPPFEMDPYAKQKSKQTLYFKNYQGEKDNAQRIEL